MKRIRHIILLSLALAWASTAGAQHYIGARGGYGGGLGRFYPAEYMKMMVGLWNGGIQWKYYSPEKYVGGVGLEVEYLQRGFEYHVGRMNSDTTYRRTVNTINVPFSWQPHINMANNHLRVYLHAGIAASYNINSQQDTLVRGHGVVFTKPYEMKLVRDNPFGFGLQFGLGFNVIFGKVEFMAEARYYFTYGDILRNRTKYPGTSQYSGNPIRSPIDNFNVSVGFYYRLGDKPHEPPPSPGAIARRQAKMAEKEVKEAEKAAEKAEKEARRAGRKERSSEPDGESPPVLILEGTEGNNSQSTGPEQTPRPENSDDNGNDQTTESSTPDTKRRQ